MSSVGPEHMNLLLKNQQQKEHLYQTHFGHPFMIPKHVYVKNTFWFLTVSFLHAWLFDQMKTESRKIGQHKIRHTIKDYQQFLNLISTTYQYFTILHFLIGTS